MRTTKNAQENEKSGENSIALQEGKRRGGDEKSMDHAVRARGSSGAHRH